MDVHLLSRLLKELIIDNDRIALPGMGYFQAEPMPAYFSEDGKTIYPPSKRISFKWDDRASGDMLAAYYTKTYGIDRNTADIELDTFLKQLKPMLHERKFIDFPGVGRLKLTLDGEAYFVTDNTDGGVFSQAFGFEPVILKPVSKSSDSAAQAEDSPEFFPEPAPVTTAIPVLEPLPAQAKTGQEESKDKNGHINRRRIWVTVLSILAAIIIAAVILVLLGRGGHLDSLIYSDEELELIRQQGTTL